MYELFVNLIFKSWPLKILIEFELKRKYRESNKNLKHLTRTDQSHSTTWTLVRVKHLTRTLLLPLEH
jgi:hypothetical protein